MQITFSPYTPRTNLYKPKIPNKQIAEQKSSNNMATVPFMSYYPQISFNGLGITRVPDDFVRNPLRNGLLGSKLANYLSIKGMSENDKVLLNMFGLVLLKTDGHIMFIPQCESHNLIDATKKLPKDIMFNDLDIIMNKVKNAYPQNNSVYFENGSSCNERGGTIATHFHILSVKKDMPKAILKENMGIINNQEISEFHNINLKELYEELERLNPNGRYGYKYIALPTRDDLKEFDVIYFILNNDVPRVSQGVQSAIARVLYDDPTRMEPIFWQGITTDPSTWTPEQLDRIQRIRVSGQEAFNRLK